MKKKLTTANFATNELCQGQFLSELIHRISHEVGNPLTAVIALASLLPIESDTEKIHEHAKSINAEAWKINSLTEKLVLLFSDGQGNQEPCDLEEAVRGAENKLKVRHGVSDLNLRIDCAENDCFANVDSAQCISLVSELLLNAVQNAASKDNSITCKIEKTSANSVTLRVSNFVDKACHLKLEDAFRPLVTSKETTHNLGLGLTIAHAICTRFSGSIGIVEEEVAGGYLFSAEVSLPAG